jgi:hypothetical protein
MSRSRSVGERERKFEPVSESSKELAWPGPDAPGQACRTSLFGRIRMKNPTTEK